MSKYILSTMTNSVSYTVYEKIGNLPVPKKKVTIYGGANLPSLRSGFGEMTSDGQGAPMWTAAGIITPVSDADYEILKEHYLFKKHLAKGLVKPINQDIRGNHAEVKRQVNTNMTKRDGFAQQSNDTFAQKIKVSTQRDIDPDAQFRI